MKDGKLIGRRNFIKLSSGMIVSAPIFSIKPGAAQELTELNEGDQNAQALGYKTDASTVNIEAYPNFEPTQSCANCLFYKGDLEDSSGPCQMFIGQTVTAAGWCSVYTIIPT